MDEFDELMSYSKIDEPCMKERRLYALSMRDKLSDVFSMDPPPIRPKRYREEYGDLVINMARIEGAPFIACLAELGISVNQANSWLLRYPHFQESKERAEVEAIRFWHKIGVLGAVGKIKGFNSDVWKLYMKNLAKFSDKVDVSAQVETVVVSCQIGDDGTIQKEQTTNQEAMALLQAALVQESEAIEATKSLVEADNVD